MGWLIHNVDHLTAPAGITLSLYAVYMSWRLQRRRKMGLAPEPWTPFRVLTAGALLGLAVVVGLALVMKHVSLA